MSTRGARALALSLSIILNCFAEADLLNRPLSAALLAFATLLAAAPDFFIMGGDSGRAGMLATLTEVGPSGKWGAAPCLRPRAPRGPQPSLIRSLIRPIWISRISPWAILVAHMFGESEACRSRQKQLGTLAWALWTRSRLPNRDHKKNSPARSFFREAGP